MEIEELFCKRYPEYSVNGKKPLSPYFDFFEEGYEQAENKYEELGKESNHLLLEGAKRVEELEQKLEQTEEDLADYQFNYPTIKELSEGTCFAHLKSLEKENAELKADNDARKFAMAMSEKVEKQLREQLTKAKKIIREIMKFDIPTLVYEKAEQFLKEIEK